MFLPIHTIHQFVLLKSNIYSICLMLLLQPLRKGDLRKDRCLRSCARVTCAKGSIFVAKARKLTGKGKPALVSDCPCAARFSLAQGKSQTSIALAQVLPCAGYRIGICFCAGPCTGFPLCRRFLTQVACSDSSKVFPCSGRFLVKVFPCASSPWRRFALQVMLFLYSFSYQGFFVHVIKRKSHNCKLPL